MTFAQGNMISLVISSVAFTYFYILSIRPAQLEKIHGKFSYTICKRYRLLSSLFMAIAGCNVVLYRWYPLAQDPFPPRFSWPYSITILIAISIAIPALILMILGIRDAGKETLSPDASHTLYGGIYQKIRHPQALGELSFWFVIALFLNSPFLLVFSCVYIPIWIAWCFIEEKDLIIRYGDAYREYRSKTGMFFPKRRKR